MSSYVDAGAAESAPPPPAVIGVAIGVPVFCISAILVIICIRTRQRRREQEQAEQQPQQQRDDDPLARASAKELIIHHWAPAPEAPPVRVGRASLQLVDVFVRAPSEIAEHFELPDHALDVEGGCASPAPHQDGSAAQQHALPQAGHAATYSGLGSELELASLSGSDAAYSEPAMLAIVVDPCGNVALGKQQEGEVDMP